MIQQRYLSSDCRRCRALLRMVIAAVFSVVTFFPLVSSAQNQATDPNDLWYRAFLTYRSSEDLEKQGKYLEALDKCNEAKALYDGLAFQFPDFQPEIVKYKRKFLADVRLRIKDAMSRRPRGSNVQVSSVPNRPSPRPNQQVEYRPESGVGISPRSYPPTGTTQDSTQITPSANRPSEFYGPSGSNVLPSWDPGRISTELLHQADSANQRRDSEIRWLNEENRRLKSERDAFEARHNQAQRELADSRRKQAEYRRQIDQFERDPGNRTAVEKARRYKALLEETMAELQASTDRNARLAKQLRAARERIRLQEERIEELESERDNLVGIIQGKGLGGEALQDLIEKNRKLTQRLDMAEKVALNAANDSEQRERDIDLLKSEIAKVKIERDRLVDENIRHQTEIETLQKKLEMLSNGLSDEEKRNVAGISEEQRAENELLRSMVLKQLRRQAQMKQAKELLLRQLDRVGARSSVLMEVVEDMARGPQLSPEEKALFRSPQVAELFEAAAPPQREGGNGDSGKVYETLIASARSGSSKNVIKGQKITVELSQLDKSARLDFQEGRYAEAEQGFLRYLHYRPRSVPCLCNLGILKIAMRNHNEAEHYLQKAIAIDSNSGLAYYLLGRTYFLQNRFDDAMRNLEQGVQLEPNNAKAHNCIGVIACQNGWVTRAERAFKRAVSLEPRFGDAHFNLAVLFSSQDRPDARQAGEHYFKALDLGIPRDASIENFLKKAASSIELGLR